MKNYLLLGAGFLLLVLVCVGVIHLEAQQTRTAMLEAASHAVKDGIKSSIDGATPEVVDDAVGKVQSILSGGTATVKATLPEVVKPASDAAHEVLDGLQGNNDPNKPAPKPQGRPQVVVKPKGGEVPVDDDDERKNELRHALESILDAVENPEAGGRGKGGPGGRDPKGPRDGGARSPEELIGGLLDLATRTARNGDRMGQAILKLSPEQEMAWGRKLHQEVLVEHKVVRDAAINKRIARIVEPLLDARLRQEISYTFTVLQSKPDDINAFSIPGGYIYINSALIDYIENDQELQFVLAHEIGHVDLMHCNRKLTYAARASDLTTPAVGGFVSILHNLMSRAYAKDEEFEADAYGFRAVIAAGQTRKQALSFPRRFGEYMKKKEVEEGNAPTDRSILGDVAARTLDHFHTHPPMEERIARLEAMDVEEPPAR